MPKSKKKSPPVSGTNCAICASVVAQGDVATCVDCRKTVHRYCAGVPLEEFISSNGCYTCLSCVKKSHEAKLADMNDYHRSQS